MTQALRILIVGPSWVGDMVMAQSLFKALKSSSPAISIDVLAPGWSLPLLDRMPEVRRGIDMPLGHGKLGFLARWQLGKTLRGSYDRAILLPNSWKSAIVPFAAKIPWRTGWLGEMRYGLLNDVRKLDKQFLSMTVQRFVALADEAVPTELPVVDPPLLRVNVADVQTALQTHGLSKQAQNKCLVLCPGAEYGAAKRWPEQRYGELAARYARQGWDIWLFGSDKDREVCQRVQDASLGVCTDLAGRTSLAQAVDLMSLADAVVSNDSGLMHVAAALERPLVALYGSSDPLFTPPLNAHHRIVSEGLACSPCFKRECPLGHLDCLNKMSVDKVDAALAALQ